MMDPREPKLPKWAQELLLLERMKSVVRFPNEPKPAPDIVGEIGHHCSAPKGSWVYSENSIGVLSHWVGSDGYLYRSQGESGSGSQVRGNYYLTRADAALAHDWRICTEAALRILRAREESEK